MSAHKSIDRLCIIIVAVTLVIAAVFCSGGALGIETTAHAVGYENRIFDRTRVHTLDIVMNDWDGFIETCESEEYSACNLVIDGESFKNAGIRAKGNTSLSSVRNMNSSRYSFKIEFDQYEKGKSYHGLDKLCLNNIIQDNTYMKDYLAYSLMYDFGVDAPLCSYVYITVNGEEWGLYLAVEAVEDSFLSRNYGSNYGELYKPDSMSFGGGRGNGRDFSMSDFVNQNACESEAEGETGQSSGSGRGGFSFDGKMPDFGGGNMPDFDGKIPEDFDFSNFDPSAMFGGGDSEKTGKGGFGGFGGGFGMGSSDVKLQYSDDEPSSYSNIFNNAKTDITKADQERLIASLKALSEQTDLENTVDTDEVLRYFVVHDFLCNGDSYTGQMIHNYYLYEEDGQLSMIPWDYNLAYGSFMGANASGSVNSPIDTPVSGGMSDRPMIAWIFGSEEYTAKYHTLFSEFIGSVDFDALITETAAMIDKYVEKDPTKFCTYEAYQKGVKAIRTYCTLRKESVQGQLDGTIPSTTEGQNADSSALIDTGDLNISDMGSMGGGGGFGGFGGDSDRKSFRSSGRSEKNGQNGENGQSASDVSPTVSVQRTGNMQQPPGGGNRPDFGGGNPPDFGGQMPEDFDPSMFGGQMPEGFDPSMFGGERPEGFDGKQPDSSASSGKDGNDSSETAPAAEEGKSDSGQSSRPSRSDFPNMGGSTQSNSAEQYILLGVSSLILLLGVLFAAKFRR